MTFITTNFTQSGISLETIKEYTDAGYLIGDENSWTLYYPNLYKNEKTNYYNKRLKNPTKDSKYIKPKDESSRLFRPLALSPDKLKSSYIMITEGEKKAIKAVQEGFNCVALAGVWAWKQTPKENNNGKISDIIPDIDLMDLKNRVIYLCYDNDMWNKPQVRNALYHFALFLICEKQAIVKIVNLPNTNEKLGLDDYLIKYGKMKFQALLDNANTMNMKDIQKRLCNDNMSLKFPVNIFDEPIKTNLINLSKILDSSVEYLASSFIFGACVLMNGRYSLCVNSLQSWIEYPTLWMSIIGTPSQKKTPCLNQFKRIINIYESELEEEYKKKKEKYEQDLCEYKIEYKVYEKNKLSKNPDYALGLPIRPIEPFKQRLTTQDSTVESLCQIQYKNEQDTKRGVNIWVDELTFFLNSLGQYKKGGSDEQYFLQAWTRQTSNIVRQNKDYTINASHSIIGTIQPAVLQKMLFKQGIDSYNGMIERWLYVCCDYEETGKMELLPYDNDLFKSIYDKLYYCKDTENQYKFSNNAQIVFNEFCKTIVNAKKGYKISDLMKSYIQKQTTYVARFSLILHCIKNPNVEYIDEQTVKNAILLSEYYIKCFEHLINSFFDSDKNANDVINYLCAKNLASISPSSLYKSNMSKYRSTDNAHYILEKLANTGRGRLQKVKNNGVKFIFYG